MPDAILDLVFLFERWYFNIIQGLVPKVIKTAKASKQEEALEKA